MTPEASLLQSALEERLNFERLIADLASKFVHLPTGNVDAAIEDAQRRICETLDIDRSTVTQFTGPDGEPVFTHGWAREGLVRVPLASAGVGEMFPWSTQRIRARQTIRFSSVDELPAEAATDKHSFLTIGPKSNVTFPLVVGDDLLGALSFGAMRSEREWPDHLVDRLRVVADMLAGTLARRRSDDALRESEARLGLVAAAAGVGVWELDLATGEYWGTPKALELYGLPEGVVVTRDTIVALTHPDDRDRLRTDWHLTLQGKVGRLEHRIFHPHAGLRWLVTRSRIRFGASGEPIKVLGVSADITTRKLAEEATARSEEVSRATFEHAAVGIAHLGIDGRFLQVNDTLCAVLGYSRDELLALNVHEITYPDDVATDVGYKLRILDDEIRTYSLEKRCIRKDHAVVWMNVTVSLVRGGAGEPERFISVMDDITERKQQRAELERHKARLATAVDVAMLGFYEQEGPVGDRVSFVDARLFKLLGLPPGEEHRLGEHWMAHVHPDDMKHVMSLNEDVERGGLEQANAEYRYIHPSRGELWFRHLAHVSARNAGGECTRQMGVIQDITERKRSEIALHELSGRLIGAQEEERRRLAKELHDGLSQNLALLSIELDLYGQHPPQEPEQIVVRLRELSATTAALSREVHRLSHGLHPAKLDQLGLAAAIGGFCRELESGGMLSVRFTARDVPRVLPADATLCLYRVAQEALQNVMKHSGVKEAIVNLVHQGDAIAMRIADEGVGFNPAAAPPSESLGVVSMRERVRSVGGEIAWQSKVGGGTTVRVRVPIRPTAGRHTR